MQFPVRLWSTGFGLSCVFNTNLLRQKKSVNLVRFPDYQEAKLDNFDCTKFLLQNERHMKMPCSQTFQSSYTLSKWILHMCIRYVISITFHLKSTDSYQ